MKAATGILIFAGGLHALSPIQEEASRSATALAGQIDPGTLTGILGGERATLWVLLAVSAANIALGIWRPRLAGVLSRTPLRPSAPSKRFALRQSRTR